MRISRIVLSSLVVLILMLAAFAPSAGAAYGFKAKFGKDGGSGTLGLNGGALISPTATALGPGGDIYVTDSADCSVNVYEADGDFLRRWGGPCAYPFNTPGDGAMFRPDGIEVALNGDVYVLEGYFQRIYVFDSNGVYLRQFAGTGVAEFGVASGFTISPLSAAPDVFVSNGNRVQKFTSTGDFIWSRGRDVVATDGGDNGSELCTVLADCKAAVSGTGDGEFNFPYGLELDAAGANLWVTDPGNSRVQQISASDGSYVSKFDVTYPGHITQIASSGDLIVSRQIQRNVMRFDSAGNLLGTIGTNAGSSAPGDVSSPVGSSRTASGGVIIADQLLHRANSYSGTGDFVEALGKNGGGEQSGTADGQFSYPSDMVQSGGKVWVADAGNNRVQRFGSGSGTWAHEASFPSGPSAPGTQGGRFNFPNGIAVDGAGNFWVADMANHRIQKLDSNGNFLLAFGFDVDIGGGTGSETCVVAANCKIGVSGTAASQFFAPIDVAVLGNVLWVAEQNNNRVQKFNLTTLAHLATIAPTTPVSAQISQPQSVAVSPAGHLYVGSYNYNIVLEFDETDTWVRNLRGDQISEGPPMFSDNGYPHGVAIASNGEIHLTQNNLGTVKVFAADGTFLRRYGARGSNDGELYKPRGIVAGETPGDMFIADTGNHRIVQFGEGVTPGTPSLVISAPAASSQTYDETTVLAYTATDSYGAAATCYPATGSVIPLNVGSNNITVTCADPVVESFSSSVQVTRVVDTTGPDIVFNNPIDGSTVNSASLTLDYTVSDDSGLASICDVANGTVIPLTLGPNTIVVECEDTFGNVTTAQATVTYALPPVVDPPAQPAPTPDPVCSVTFGKKYKFKGKVSASVSCDRGTAVTFSVTAKVGKKKFTAKTTATVEAGRIKKVSIKYPRSATKAITEGLASRKKPKFNYSLLYSAKAGKSGAVKNVR